MGEMTAVDVYLEVGDKRVFAAAVGWPGWCRSGRDEVSALQALVDYGLRYEAAVGKSAGAVKKPVQTGDLRLVERLQGDSATDFGAPHVPPSLDSLPLESVELDRLSQLLQACWQAFDSAARAAASTPLRTGPRGGGRNVSKMHAHILDAESMHLTQLGGKSTRSGRGTAADLRLVRQAFLDTLSARVRDELPIRGPKGGLRWSPRYAVRRSAWHSLDHAWEIEDRLP